MVVEPLLRRVVRGNGVIVRTARRMAVVAGLDPISRYVRGGRRPWSPGYSKFKNQFLQDVLADPLTMQCFREHRPLPAGFGPRLDERVVECPWVIAHLRPGTGRILDAGSVLNTPLLLELPALKPRRLVIYSLEMDWITLDPRISYIHADFREPLLGDETFETIVCISTLEHVGMWPIPKAPWAEALARPQPAVDRFAYRDALAEFRRLLVKGGQLLITVPFGRAEDHRWLQQFDAAGIADIVAAFGGDCQTETYFRYSADGWQLATGPECADRSYFNIVRARDFDDDYAAAARAVACLELVRTR
jgi:hypothetical protein